MKLFASVMDKANMFNVLKHAIDIFVWDKVSPHQQYMLMNHIQAMESYGGTYEVNCEVAQSADQRSMKLTITVHPARS